MAALVTQEEALRQLRLTAGTVAAEELTDVMFKAEQASEIIVDYLKRGVQVNPLAPTPFAPTTSPAGVMPAAPYVPPPWTELTTPVMVKAAILIVLTALYDGRTPGDELLSEAITSILHRWRDPALA